MLGIISAKRKNDAVITVCQDNSAQHIIIENLNKAAEKLTGYKQEELVQKDFNYILPPAIIDDISSFLEYGDGDDLANVLRRIRLFKILKKNGNQIPVSLKVFYVVSSEANKPFFELLMRDTTLLEKLEELKKRVIDNRTDEFINKKTGLLTQKAILENLRIILDFVRNYSIESSIAVMEIDEKDKLKSSLGQRNFTELCSNIQDICTRTLRAGDFVGINDDNRMCFVLLDCNRDDVMAVLKRLDAMVTKKAITIAGQQIDSQITLSFGYTQLNKSSTPESALKIASDALQQAINNGGKRMYEG